MTQPPTDGNGKPKTPRLRLVKPATGVVPPRGQAPPPRAVSRPSVLPGAPPPVDEMIATENLQRENMVPASPDRVRLTARDVIQPQGAPPAAPMAANHPPSAPVVGETPSQRMKVIRGRQGISVEPMGAPPANVEKTLAKPPTLPTALTPPKHMVNPNFRIVFTTVKAGARWKEYQMIGPIQTGFTGVTYEGYHVGRQQRVAIKFLDLPDDDETRARFEETAEKLKNFRHASICPVIDYVWQPPYTFLVTELMTTPHGLALNLEDYCFRYVDEDAFTPARQVLKVGYQLVMALEAAHQAGLLHGDLKPANLLFEYVEAENNTWRLRMRITDLGIAQVYGELGYRHKMEPMLSGAEDIDQPGIETAAFMAPEQWDGAPISVATDLFGTGALIHYFLTLNWEAKRKKPSAYRNDIDGNWDPVVCKVLRTDPARRYASASEFADYLEIIDVPDA